MLSRNSIKNASWLLIVVAIIAIGCGQQPRRSNSRAARGGDADAYVRSVAATLNDLAANVDLELLPAQPILTAANSLDGNEVRAVCIENPRFPDGVFNYLLLTDRNVDLTRLDIQSGDKVRYYANFDQESAERGIEQRKAIELEVLRLDPANPQSGIIIKGGLSGAMPVPQRLEIWRQSQSRVDAIKSAFAQYVNNRQPPAGWEPAPDLGAIRQIVDRANQWLRNTLPKDDQWTPDSMLATLPVELREAKGVAPLVAEEHLRDGLFGEAEGRLLAEAAWCRDISQWARRPAAGQSEADAAAKLFDWTVRNIQLDRPDAPAIVPFLWQALAYGHGTPAHRAWAFAELCRHQRIDAVILEPAAAVEGAPPPPLLVGVIAGDDVLVFDPQLGLPLPGPDGGVATLAQLAADDRLLRKLDLPGGAVYPLTAEQMKQVQAAIVASPLQLSRRAARLEAALKGDEFIQLSVDPAPIAERLKQHSQIADVTLWEQPTRAIADAYSLPISLRAKAAEQFQPFAQRPLLWQGRLLHFQGSKDVRAAERDDPLAEPREGHRDALNFYQQPNVRPSDAKIEKIAEGRRSAYAAAKDNATLWLGLLSYDLGNESVAVEWLEPLLAEQTPVGPWVDGAQYNLARAFESLGRADEAINLLEATDERSPQRHGNLLRAKRLQSERPAGPVAP
jgi:tetratricopeptide (TPR) repeat protein